MISRVRKASLLEPVILNHLGSLPIDCPLILLVPPHNIVIPSLSSPPSYTLPSSAASLSLHFLARWI